jgi:hypothetical protein
MDKAGDRPRRRATQQTSLARDETNAMLAVTFADAVPCPARAQRAGGSDMRRLAGTIAVAAIASALGVAAAEAQNIGGRYQVQGRNFNGSTYTGVAEIIVTSDTTCRINWNIGGQIWRGICMRNGQAFSAAYRLGNTVGLVIYQLNLDGSMQGLWTLADQNGVGQENLIPGR